MWWTSITLSAQASASSMPACAQKNLNLHSMPITVRTWGPLSPCSSTPQMLTCHLNSISTTLASLSFRVPKFQVATLILVLVFFIFFIFLVFLAFFVFWSSWSWPGACIEMLPAFHLRRLLALPNAYRLFNIQHFHINWSNGFDGATALPGLQPHLKVQRNPGISVGAPTPTDHIS